MKGRIGRRGVRRSGAAGLTAAVLALGGGAATENAEGRQPEARAAAQPEAGIALAGQVELARLVDLAAQRLGLAIQYDANALKGAVTLRLGAGVPDSELWPLLNRVLASQGFTTVRLPGDRAYSVVRLADAPALARVQDGPGPDGPPAGFQTLVIRAQHRPAKELADAFRPLLSKTGASVTELPGTGLVVVADLAPRLEEALRIVASLDVPSAAPVVEELPLRHLSATALVALATQVAGKRELVSGQKLPGELVPLPGGKSVLLVAPGHAAAAWRELIGQLDQREPVTTATYTPRAFAPREVAALIENVLRPADGAAAAGADERWRLVIDELTGSLIITATAAQHEEIRALLQRVDVAAPEARRPMRSFVIRNRSLPELLGVLQSMLGAGVLDQPVGDPLSGEPLAPDLTAPDIGRTERPVDPRGGPPVSVASQPRPPSSPLLRDLGRGGRELPRVEVDSELILTADEATSTIIAIGDSRRLAQLEALIRQLDVRQPQVMLEVLMVSLSEAQSLALGIELQQELNLSGDTRATLASLFGLAQRSADGIPGLGTGAGFTGLVLNPGDFSVVLRALETLNQGRALSIPRVLVGNNQQGTFSSVLQQPFATVNTGTATSTTSFGGTLDAGTIASVRPQIAAGDHLILEYSVQLSSFVGTSSVEGLPPPKQTNSVASSVTIPDGHTVVVGGLELLTEADAESRVPLIGGIPILGELFKNRTKNHSRDRFFVFIRANIIRHDGFEDLKYLSIQDRAAARVEDGWPEVRPRMIR